jgi:hypothetical protein
LATAGFEPSAPSKPTPRIAKQIAANPSPLDGDKTIHALTPTTTLHCAVILFPLWRKLTDHLPCKIRRLFASPTTQPFREISLLPANKALILALTLVSPLSIADEWTTSSGLSVRDAHSTQPGAGYKDRGWSANASMSKSVEGWSIGGALSYSLSTLDQDTNSARKTPKSLSGVAMASRDIGDGRSVSATLGYGSSAANSSEVTGGNTITYSSDSNFLSTSVGLSQSLSLSRRSMAIVSARYTHVRSTQKSYTTSAGTSIPESNSGFGFTTLGVGYNHRFGRFTPYIQADWNVSNRAFIDTDKHYATINTGINYRVNATTNVGVSLSTVVNKAYSRDNSLGVSVSHAF